MKLKNKIIFMTGATSGFVKVAACHMASQGALVVATSRNQEKGHELLASYLKNYPDGKGQIDLIKCDLDSFESIVSACHEVQKKYDRLDMIINNAGVMNFNFRASANDIEQTFQINLLAPVLIIHLLSGMLEQSPEPKIINTASALHQGIIHFEDLESRKKFTGFDAYRQSKLGIILISRYLAEKNINIYSQHPGLVKTELGRDFNRLAKAIFRLMGKSPKKGARTLLNLVETPVKDLTSGEYYADCKIKKITEESYDLAVAEKLLETTRSYLSPYLTEPSFIF